MNKHLQMVRQFHTVFGYEQAHEPALLTDKNAHLRCAFIAEELSEFLLATAAEDKVAELDAVIDTAYFCLGTMAMMGMHVAAIEENQSVCEPQFFLQACCSVVVEPLILTQDPKKSYMGLNVLLQTCKDYCKDVLHCSFDLAFAEVHRSNMSKLDGQGNPLYSEHGKIIKSALYSPRNLQGLIND